MFALFKKLAPVPLTPEQALEQNKRNRRAEAKKYEDWLAETCVRCALLHAQNHYMGEPLESSILPDRGYFLQNGYDTEDFDKMLLRLYAVAQDFPGWTLFFSREKDNFGGFKFYVGSDECIRKHFSDAKQLRVEDMMAA